jgi:hypothetical protein
MAFCKAALAKKTWHFYNAFFISYVTVKHCFYENIFIF